MKAIVPKLEITCPHPRHHYILECLQYVRAIALTYWGRSADQPQVEACIVHMKRHLKLPHGIELVDANNIPFFTGTRGVVYCVHGLDFSVKGRNDVLIVPRSVLNEAEDFVVIGMQIKESLDPESLEHAQAQLIPWGLQSYSAYMQVLSDLRSGGVAWWVDAEEIVPGMQTIRRQFFAGMPAMYSFLNSALAAIPERMSGFDASGHRIEGRETPFSAVLEQPRRRKLEDPSLQEPNALRDIIRNILAARGDDDAAEPDIALADWFPHGGDEPIRFPDEPSSQPCPS